MSDDEELEAPEPAGGAGPRRGWQKWADRLAGAPAAPAKGSTPARAGTRGVPATRWQVDRLEANERRWSFAAAAVAVIFGVTIYVSETRDTHFHLAKGQLTPQTMLVVGLVLAALLVATTLLGRRGPVAFVALFAGIAFFSYGFLGLLFWVLGIWLLYRGYKAQKAAAAAARASGEPPPASALEARRAGRAGRGGGTADTTAAPSGPRRPPTANKRYTPKLPPPGAPRPSRRERRRATGGS